VGEVKVQEDGRDDGRIGQKREDLHFGGPRFARCPAGHSRGSTS
jgi:hypothetical protein